MPSILLVGNEPASRTRIRDLLGRKGYSVESSNIGDAACEKADLRAFDLLILDISGPVERGFRICSEFRKADLAIPIFLLTARVPTNYKITGIKLGADDYIMKPFDLEELIARIEALLRRARITSGTHLNVYRFGSVAVDLRGTEVMRNGKIIKLSAREFQLLRYLIEHSGSTISRTTLLKKVWGYDIEIITRAVDILVANLRQKIEDDAAHPRFILTTRGIGYTFRP